MCGIFGTTRQLSDAEIKHTLAQLHHRGPDSHGVQVVRTERMRYALTLLHTRLAIQDLSASGHQPMASKDGRWWITFNGEIYNHKELRRRLDVPFAGSSDTETLVEYIAAFGVDRAIRDVNGIYAFGIFDSQQSRLYLIRDPFGVKPLYFHHSPQALTFSSEIGPLRDCLETQPALNTRALDLFLALRYVPAPDTLLDKIQRLQPGHHAVIDMNGNMNGDMNGARGSTIEIISDVQPTTTHFSGSRDDARAHYRDALGKAVERQLISDVPVGVLLSGGIDSAVIAALAREHTDDLMSFTVGFGSEHAECEIDDAAETARILGIPHEQVTIEPVSMIDSLDQIVAAVEEPLGTTSILPMWYLTKLARQKATVVLAGQGNDEPWGGYRRYQIELLLQHLPFLKLSPFRAAGKATALVRNDGYRRGLACLGLADDTSRFAAAYALFSDEELQLLGRPATAAKLQPIAYWLQQLAGDRTVSPAERMMRIDTRMNLADDLLLYADKVSMAHSLEVRVPMLDPDVVRLVEGLPLSYKASLRETKIIHRAMASEYLPASIVNRPKKGFQVPFGLWCKTVWRDYIHDHLLAPDLKISTVLNNDGLKTIYRRHETGRFDYSRQLFALLTLSLWIESFLTVTTMGGKRSLPISITH